MAEFKAVGLDELALSLQEIAEIPEDIRDQMLEVAAPMVVDAQKASIRALGLVDTGKLLDSIKAHKKIKAHGYGDIQRYILIYPTGKHGERHQKQITKQYKRSKHGRTYTVGGDVKDVTNNEVGFIQEFGAPKRGIRGKQWMRVANERIAPAVERAQADIYYRWQDSRGL